MEKKDLVKGEYIVEPTYAISDFVERLNKLSYQNFPIEDVLHLLKKNDLSYRDFEPYIFFSDARYTRNLIHKDPNFEILVLCWRPKQFSPIHGHEGQKCWMKVMSGTLEFTDYQEVPKNDDKLIKKVAVNVGKAGYVDGPARIHKVENISDKEDAVSLHIYAMPFDQCELYEADLPEKRRVPLNYHSIHGQLVAPEDKRA